MDYSFEITRQVTSAAGSARSHSVGADVDKTLKRFEARSQEHRARFDDDISSDQRVTVTISIPDGADQAIALKWFNDDLVRSSLLARKLNP